MPKSNEIDIAKETFKRINNLGDLKKWITFVSQLLPKETPIKMYSDAEGNQVNKVLALEYTEMGLSFISWE